MPEEQNNTPAETTSTPTSTVVKTQSLDFDDQSKQARVIKISRTNFIGVVLLLIVLFAAGLFLAYSFGQTNGKSSTTALEKKETPVKKEEPGVQTVGINEEVTVNSGITIKLEEAMYDKAYEQQKNESKSYYEKNASQSAYLESDYFKNSNLIIKVLLDNQTKKAVSYSPSSFRLKDSKDVQYVASFEGDKQVYGLNPDEKTRTSLSYIVPTTEKSFRLIYENAVIEFTLK